MGEVLAVILILCSLIFAVPLPAVALPRDLRWFPMPLVTGFGLSLGAITLLMAFLAIVPWPGLSIWPSLVLMLTIGLVGSLAYLRARRRRNAVSRPGGDIRQTLMAEPLLTVALGGIVLLTAGMVLVSLYYPLVGSDAMAIYGYAARKIFVAGGMDGWRIPEMDWYAGSYPLLLPLSYVYAWLAAGEVNEYLAKIYAAAFHVATVAATYSRVPGSGVRERGSGERETTASSLAGKEESSRKEDNSGQGKDGPAGAIAQGGNGR